MNFPQEILDIILAHNDQYEIDWRVNQFASLGTIRKCFDKRRPQRILCQATHESLLRSGCEFHYNDAHGVGQQIRAFKSICESRGKGMKPSQLKFKYVKKAIRN